MRSNHSDSVDDNLIIGVAGFWRTLVRASEGEIEERFNHLKENPKYGSKNLSKDEKIVALSIEKFPGLLTVVSETMLFRRLPLLFEEFRRPPLSVEEIFALMRGKEIPGRGLSETVNRVMTESS